MIKISTSNPLPESAPPPQPWDRFEISTQPFRELYKQVTVSLLAYAAILPGGVVGADYIWFKYLVYGFEAEYQKWATNLHMRSYLERTDRLSKAGRLILYAYLHIAYDLPRVIADSLVQRDGPPLARCKQIFAKADYTFIEAFYNCSRKWSVFGINSILPNCLYALNRSWFASFAFAFGTWPLLLRNEAWDMGEKLASATNRQNIEENIWRFIDEHTSGILLLTKNSRKIAMSLRSPRGCVAIPLLLFFFDDWLFYLVLGVFVLALAGVLIVLLGYRRLSFTSDSVGREIYKGMRSIRASFNEGLTKGTSTKEEVIDFCDRDETIPLSKIKSIAIKLQNHSEPKTFEPEETMDLEAYDEKKRAGEMVE